MYYVNVRNRTSSKMSMYEAEVRGGVSRPYRSRDLLFLLLLIHYYTVDEIDAMPVWGEEAHGKTLGARHNKISLMLTTYRRVQ